MLVPVIMMNALAKTGTPYDERVLGTEAANIIWYYKLNETSGTTADNAEGTAARDGTYSGVTLDQIAAPVGGDTAPQWDATNDVLDFHAAGAYSSALDGDEFTCAGWFKMRAASVWTDSSVRYFFRTHDTANDNMHIRRTAVDNTLEFVYESGGTVKTVSVTSITDANWHHIAMVHSLSGDAMTVYIDGVAETPLTGVGTWTGDGLTVDTSVLGGDDTGPTQVHDGYMSRWATWSKALTAGQISNIAS